MSNFDGLPVLCSVVDGSTIEGIVRSIDATKGTITLDSVTIRKNGQIKTLLTISLSRGQVTGLQLLSIESNSNSEQPTPITNTIELTETNNQHNHNHSNNNSTTTPVYVEPVSIEESPNRGGSGRKSRTSSAKKTRVS